MRVLRMRICQSSRIREDLQDLRDRQDHRDQIHQHLQDRHHQDQRVEEGDKRQMLSLLNLKIQNLSREIQEMISMTGGLCWRRL